MHIEVEARSLFTFSALPVGTGKLTSTVPFICFLNTQFLLFPRHIDYNIALYATYATYTNGTWHVYSVHTHTKTEFKGTVSRNLRLLVFLMNQFSPSPWLYHYGRFDFFFLIRGDIHSSRCTTSVNDTGGKWKKSSIRKFCIISFGHLWVVELSYR